MRGILAALLLLGAAIVPALAQETARIVAREVVERPAVPASMFSAAIFRNAVIRVRSVTLQGVHTADLSGPRLPARSLRFRRTWRVEQQARERLLGSLLRTNVDPETREEIKESVASGDVWHEFDRTLGFAGYSSSNLADVTTAYYVIAWQVVSGVQAIDFLAGIRLVRDSVALALLHDPRVAEMSDAEKQEAAVVMAYKAIVAAHRARELRGSNDRAGLVQLRRAIRDSVVQGQGVDLEALRLTNLGFVAD